MATTTSHSPDIPQDKATRAKINDFAQRSFRDVADHDYILARLAYRAGLFPQFQWCALQAIEKYLKGILLFNRIPAKRIGHDLGKALDCTERLPFTLRLTDQARAFISYLDHDARFRYLETGYAVHGPRLVQLDRTVWEVRRYCRVLNYDIKRNDGGSRNLLTAELAAIEDSERRPYHRFRILGGRLEKIIANRAHPSRPGLLWKNLFFGTRTRTRTWMSVPFYAENAPLWLHPEILDEVLKYVHLPKEVEGTFRAEIATRSKSGSP